MTRTKLLHLSLEELHLLDRTLFEAVRDRATKSSERARLEAIQRKVQSAILSADHWGD